MADWFIKLWFNGHVNHIVSYQLSSLPGAGEEPLRAGKMDENKKKDH